MIYFPTKLLIILAFEFAINHSQAYDTHQKPQSTENSLTFNENTPIPSIRTIVDAVIQKTQETIECSSKGYKFTSPLTITCTPFNYTIQRALFTSSYLDKTQDTYQVKIHIFPHHKLQEDFTKCLSILEKHTTNFQEFSFVRDVDDSRRSTIYFTHNEYTNNNLDKITNNLDGLHNGLAIPKKESSNYILRDDRDIILQSIPALVMIYKRNTLEFQIGSLYSFLQDKQNPSKVHKLILQ